MDALRSAREEATSSAPTATNTAWPVIESAQADAIRRRSPKSLDIFENSMRET
jgi:hypothetical protein